MDLPKIAALAKLHITDGQMEAYAQDMEAILAMVERLPDITDGGPALQATMTLREDIVTPSLPRQALLQNTPDSDGPYSIVPRVMEDVPEG